MMIEGLDCAPTHEMFPPFIPIPFRPYLGLITRRQRYSVYYENVKKITFVFFLFKRLTRKRKRIGCKMRNIGSI